MTFTLTKYFEISSSFYRDVLFTVKNELMVPASEIRVQCDFNNTKIDISDVPSHHAARATQRVARALRTIALRPREHIGEILLRKKQIS